MPIPALTADGYLPEGIHDCTLQELADRFGQFQRTDARWALFRRLESFVGDVAATGFFTAIIIDGSFVSGVDAPNDVDLILVLKSSHDFTAPTRPFEYNIVSRHQVRRRYRFDVLIGKEHSKQLARHIAFFARVRDNESIHKGMVRLTL
jgi:hypothetical protein